MTKSYLKTGVIGLGAMGTSMAHNLHTAGALKQVWNRNPNKAKPFGTLTTVATTPQALAKHCELIIVCVSRDHDVKAMIDTICQTIKPNTIVADTSTVSTDTARHAATILQTKGVHFLDCPVSGGVEGAKNGSLAMMVGGKANVLAKAQHTLSAIAKNIVHMGEHGAGQATKAVNQIMAAGINQAVTEALSFGHAMGLNMEKVIDVVATGAAGNWFLTHRGKSMIADEYLPGFKLALHHKDLSICKQMSAEISLPLPLVEQTLKDYQTLMEKGYSDEDISALFRLKHKPKTD